MINVTDYDVHSDKHNAEIERLCRLAPEEYARDPLAHALAALMAALGSTRAEPLLAGPLMRDFVTAYAVLTPDMVREIRAHFLWSMNLSSEETRKYLREHGINPEDNR